MQVAGNFHFSADSQDQAALLAVYRERASINVSHVVHALSFGPAYPSKQDPLLHTIKIVMQGARARLRAHARTGCLPASQPASQPASRPRPSPGTLSRPPTLLQ
jgi:hypothetical protein